MVYRIYAPEQDGKTKKIKAKRILFDSWYAPVVNLKLVHGLGLIFFKTLKINRMVSLAYGVSVVGIPKERRGRRARTLLATTCHSAPNAGSSIVSSPACTI
jgi:hypothetical protein